MYAIWVILLALTAMLSSGCSRAEAPEGAAYGSGRVCIETIRIDNYWVRGSTVQCFSTAPERVLVVGESEQELLLDLGVDVERLILVRQNNRSCSMKEENARLFEQAQVIPWAALNVESVMALRPDFIVGMQNTFSRQRLRSTDFWNRRGIRTAVSLNSNNRTKHLHEETIAREMQFIKDMGVVFRREQKAQEIIDETYATIRAVKEKTKDLYKPKVMIIEMLNYIVTYDRKNLAGDMVSAIGGRIGEGSPVVGYEEIIREDPDVLFVVCSHRDCTYCMGRILHQQGLKNLRCVKNGAVYAIPLRFAYGTLSRTGDAILFLAERMYRSDFTN